MIINQKEEYNMRLFVEYDARLKEGNVDNRWSIGTTKHYDANDASQLRGKIVTSAYTNDFSQGFNTYRRIRNKYGKHFGWKDSKDVVNLVKQYNNEWYNERNS